MENYHDLMREILVKGIRQSNRTGIDTYTIPGAMLRFDLSDGFPAITTKKLFFDVVKGELIGFLRGVTSAADFRALGCKVWDQNANETPAWLANRSRKGEDDLGRIYGAQWRNWRGMGPNMLPMQFDQIATALDTLRNNPESRRIIVNAWNAAEIDQAALPPCHVLFQLLPHVDTKILHMTMYQRSADMFLGVPFNIASYALLLELFAAWSGYRAGTLTMFFADAHIYENHVDQVREQLTRKHFGQPRLGLHLPEDTDILPLQDLLELLQPEDIQLVDYQSHAAIKAPMAV